MPSFYDYFRENMESLGLPAPQSLFGSVSTAIATSTTILTQVEKFGRKVTIREIIGAGTQLEKLAVIGACSAAYYAGAVIGSIAVALGRTLGNGTSLSDVLFVARSKGLHTEWLADCLRKYPDIYVADLPGDHHQLDACLA
jgi:hypothetical protein